MPGRASFGVAATLHVEGGRLELRRDMVWEIEAGRTSAWRAAAPGDEVLDVVLIPGLVNAHSHLDLAGSGPVDAAGSFPDWLMRIGGLRGVERDIVDTAAGEADQLAVGGVTAAGDIDGSAGKGTRGRRRARLAGRSYLEIVGVNAESARARLAQTLRHVDTLGRGSEELGLSPHAPYSVHEQVLPEIVKAAAARGLPLAMHLAESEEETRYLTHGDGPFLKLLESIGRGAPFAHAPGLRPIAYAERAGLLSAGALVIHGNDLDDEDIGHLSKHRAAVVYCHGTHRHFDRPAHRLLELVEAGVVVAFGTDSGASNQGVDLHSELCRLARDRPDIPPQLLLQGATIGGRMALHLPEGPAAWSVGSSADACILGPCPEELGRMGSDALAEWIWTGEGAVQCTIHGGRVRQAPGESSERLVGHLDSLSPQG